MKYELYLLPVALPLLRDADAGRHALELLRGTGARLEFGGYCRVTVRRLDRSTSAVAHVI